jgi:hypothetical protein
MLKKSLLALIIFVSLMACTSETKSITFKTIEVKTAFDADISVLYDVAEGTNGVSTTINKHIEQAIVESIGLDSSLKDISTVLKTFNKQYVEFITDFPDSALAKWELQVETEKTYQSDDVITLAISVYEYQGGAHGNSHIHLLNINPKTGKIFKLDAIIEDIKGFESLAKTYFIKNLTQKDENLKMEDYFFGEPFHLPENMGFSDDGFILLYNVYEVASYAQGYTEFAIPYDDMDPYLKLY